MGFIRDTLQGKEKKIKADALAKEINNTGRTGLGLLNEGSNSLADVYRQDPTQLVNTQIGMENAVARTAAEDASRRTRSILATRGMGNSSIGIGQQVNQARDLNKNIAMNNASGISRLRDAQIQNGEGLTNIGSRLFGVKTSQGPIQMNDQKYRSGGYGELIVGAAKAGAGMYAGGA